MEIKEIVEDFLISGEVIKVEKNNSGLINKSYIVSTTNQNYIIQKINNFVFKRPFELMSNIEKVINYLNKKRNNKCENLELIHTKEGNNCLVKNNNYYRCYNFVNNSTTYDLISNYKQIEQMGKIIGEFHTQLSDFDNRQLFITIEDFHNTPKRYYKLLEIYKKSSYEKQIETINLLTYIIENEVEYNKITKQLESNTIPYRVVHNDTKINNIIFDKKTKYAKCLIDFDTIMPGSLLYDFGDALRSSAATEIEDSKNLQNIKFNIDLFTYFLIGYVPNIMFIITEEEKKLLIDSIYIVTMELAIRFLTDYLDDNKYFSIKYEKHNLDRSINQVILAKDIKRQQKKLEEIVDKVFKHFKDLQ